MTNAQLVRHGEQWFLNGRQVPAPGNIDQVSNWRKASRATQSSASSPTTSGTLADASPPSTVSSLAARRNRTSRARSSGVDSVVSPSGRTPSEAAQTTPNTDATSTAVSIGEGEWLYSRGDWEEMFKLGELVAQGGTGLLGWPRGEERFR
jgi:hypothetical protein